jgi:PAS domain S-box-containing protein
METLVNSFGEFMFVIDSKGIIRAIWTASESFPHRQPRAVLGTRLQDLICGKDYAPVRKLLQRVRRTERSERMEFPVCSPCGTRWFVTRAIPLMHRPKRSDALFFMAREITDRKLVDQNLRKSQALLAESERLANTGSWELDLKTGAVVWSDNLYRLHGCAPSEVTLNRELCLQMLHPDDRERAKSLMAQAISSLQPVEHEFRCTTQDGRLRTLQTRFAPFFSESGEPIRIVGSTQDVTDRKLAEEKIQKSETLLAQAERIANLGSWEWDLETDALTWSEQGYRMADMDPSRPPPSLDSMWDLIHPDDRERLRALIDQSIAQGVPLEYEARLARADGTIREVHSRALPIANASGRIVRLVGMSQDITERRNEENRLRRSEALLDQAEEIAGFGCWEYDVPTGNVILSKKLSEMYGFPSSDDWDAERYWDNVLRSDRDLVRRMVLDAIDHCKPFEYVTRYRVPDGTARTYHVRGVPVAAGDGSAACVRGVVHDITSQLRNEEELRRLSQDLMCTQDTERRQIARNLHESAGQTLAALKMTLANLEDALREDTDESLSHVEDARGLAENAIREIRVVSYLMHPPMLDEAGLGPTLQWYSRGFSERSEIETSIEVSHDLGRLPQQVETTVFRIVQEALTNVHRYSGSRTATIRLSRIEGEVCVEIQDQGCGLQPLAPGRNTRLGVGIAGMRERVKQLNGTFEIESVAGRGTRVRAVLPVVPQESRPEYASRSEIAVETTKGG